MCHENISFTLNFVNCSLYISYKFTIPNIEFLIFFSDIVCLPSHDDFHSIYTAVGVWHIKNININVISTMVILFSCTIKVSLCININIVKKKEM